MIMPWTGARPAVPAPPTRRAGLSLALLFAVLPAMVAARPAATTAGDPFDAGIHAVRVFRGHDGLPQNTVHAITLDQRGHLWIATQDGAAFYNGSAWTVVNMPHRERSNFVRAILPATDGSLWFGTYADGIHRLADGQWSVPPGLELDGRHQRINALLETAATGEAVVWVGTHDGGVVRLDSGGTRVYDHTDGLPSDRVWSLFETVDVAGRSTIWVGTEAGLATLSGDQATVTTTPSLPRGSVNSLAETVDPNGEHTLWAGIYGGGVAALRGGRWRRITTRDGLPSDFVTSLFSSPASAPGVLWVGTDGGGVARLEGDRISVLDITTGLPASAAYCMLQTTAAEGTDALWIGTRNGGLARLKQGEWRSFAPSPDGTPLPVSALLESSAPDGAGVMWLGTDGGGLFRLHNGRWSSFNIQNGSLPSDFVQALLETRDASGRRSLWVGTRNGGLARLRDGRWSTFNQRSGALPNDIVQALLETADAEGRRTLWIGTRDGLARFTGGRWEVVEPHPALRHAGVLSLLETTGRGRRTLWVGTADGLVRRDEGGWQVVDLDGVVANHSVQCLAETVDQRGRRYLWVGTDGGGAARLDLSPGGGWLTITDASRPSLPNNVVYSVLEDAQHRVYLLTNRGVARLTARTATADDASEYTASIFTVEDGLPLDQGMRAAGLVDRRGRVWVGTVAGAAALDPRSEKPDRAPKQLHLRATVSGSPPRALVAGEALPYSRSGVLFEFALLSFFRERDTTYRTQLAGLDDAPSRWSHDAKKEYTTLPRGSYTFRVWGRDYAGNVTGPVELAFSVRPAPWLSWWALTLAALVAALAVYTLIQVRLRAHRHREVELRSLVDARTRQLKEANELLIELSYLDPLTGIANRRRFDERLDQEWRRAARSGSLLAVIMLDIDWFKPFNDTYGHPRGDECLRQVAAALSDALPRAGDMVARYGGEEFAVILPATDGDGAATVAEQLRQRVERLAIATAVSPVRPVVTVSCGVAATHAEIEGDPEDLVRSADEALYAAKQAGRNRTATAGTQ